jgi:glycosyltransferase involved in cell wall biosynthesis
MNQIAVLVPTYQRVSKLKSLIRNFRETSSFATLYFVITPEDKESKLILDSIGEKYFIVDGEYCKSVNYGVAHTKEEFVLFAADDVIFMPGWDKRLLEMAEDKTMNIFGGTDMWKISKTMLHISHAMIRRSYIKGNLFYPDYIHYMEDIELIQRGLREGCVSITSEVLIEHPHPYAFGKPESEFDDTYKRSLLNRKHDNDVYDRRAGEFAMYDHNFFHDGLVVPTKLNPLYNKTLVSIIIPTYNDIDYLKQCLQSVVNNTFYRYELIIIDDASDDIQQTNSPWDLIDAKKLLESFELKDESCILKVIRNSEHQWVNYNWNVGAQEATGDYIVVLNSDTTVSYHWDKFLVAALESPIKKFTISCPFETNPKMPHPFALHPFFVKYNPNMLKGACFMFRKSDVPKLFPIPDEIKHWCGDNVLSDRAEKMDGVCFVKDAIIHHYLTQAGKRMDRKVYTDRITKDIVAYENWSGKSMKHVKDTLPYQDRWLDD